MRRRNRAAIRDAIGVLNRVHAADPTVLPVLFAHRVRCNEALADDPSVQVKQREGHCDVGLLGIINGLFGVDAATRGFISAHYDGGELTHFAWTKPRRKAS